MASNNFDETMAALFKGMDGFITSKTVVGDAIKFEDGTTILPLIDVSFGAGAGAFASESKKKDNGVGAMSGKITPSSVLVIKNGNVRLVKIKMKKFPKVIQKTRCLKQRKMLLRN